MDSRNRGSLGRERREKVLPVIPMRKKHRESCEQPTSQLHPDPDPSNDADARRDCRLCHLFSMFQVTLPRL